MNDDTPLDLYRLDPGAPPDLVKGAMKRFRWRVVTLTLVVILACASAAGVIAYLAFHLDLSWKAQAQGRLLPSTERAIVDGGGMNCTTPTYRVGPVDITLLQITPLAGGWAMHLLLDAGDRPVTVQRSSDGSSFPRSMFVSPVETGIGSTNGQSFLPYVRAGWTSAEMYVAVPAGLGDRFDMRLSGTRGEELGVFTIDLHDLGLTVVRTADSMDVQSAC